MRLTHLACGLVAATGLALVTAEQSFAQAGQMECRTTIGGRQICEETQHSRMLREAREREAAQRSAGMSATLKPASPPTVYSWRDVKPAPCSKFDSFSSSGNYCEARQQAAARKAVGDTIAQGKCDEALKMALGTGDLDFAREVRDFCKPASP